MFVDDMNFTRELVKELPLIRTLDEWQACVVSESEARKSLGLIILAANTSTKHTSLRGCRLSFETLRVSGPGGVQTVHRNLLKADDRILANVVVSQQRMRDEIAHAASTSSLLPTQQCAECGDAMSRPFDIDIPVEIWQGSVGLKVWCRICVPEEFGRCRLRFGAAKQWSDE
ncbi:hypothetical protein BDY19DRAFT_902367 [Irpex rosettiformis]|uniref:Uncharacterized protein n=1 Tax=Irpex rosettiformis TaxID=378272 RepID=A0ACB8UGX7_9APHY|nr:hypothetical protein BDY19DRAFT_902367 [Irpex rosettiformis]